MKEAGSHGFTRSSSTGSREVETVRWWPMLHISSDKGLSQVSQVLKRVIVTELRRNVVAGQYPLLSDDEMMINELKRQVPVRAS